LTVETDVIFLLVERVRHHLSLVAKTTAKT